ncbi:WD40-repeat-containing domain protein [Cubamyces menziesii]|nr:WD40-repeat-containing domain protein [Cubamyces menziesii]
MVLRYLETARLTRGHSSGVSALAFSACGTYLASGGLDGKASLTWEDSGENTVICGLQDGTIVALVITEVDLLVAGFWGHSYPVECLTTLGGLLVSGAHEEVRVWKKARFHAEWVQETELPGPPKTSFNRLLQVVVTSLRLVRADSQDRVLLAVTYLNHGVHLFDASTWDYNSCIPIPGQIADASISQDAKHIAISNVISGFDVYSIESGQAVCSFGHTVGQYRKIPVLLIHAGRALVGGNVQGDVHLWDVQSGRKLHSLLHQKDDRFLQ